MNSQDRQRRDADLRPFLEKARCWTDELDDLVVQIEIPGGKRNHLAAATSHISRDFGEGVVCLMEKQRYTAASALVRPSFEACVRAAWIAFAATEKDLEKYHPRKRDPFDRENLRERIDQVERTENFKGGVLSRMRTHNWAILNGLTHAGSDQIFRNLSGAEITSRHTPGECLLLLEISRLSAILSVVTLAAIADRNDVAKQLLELTRRLDTRFLRQVINPTQSSVQS